MKRLNPGCFLHVFLTLSTKRFMAVYFLVVTLFAFHNLQLSEKVLRHSGMNDQKTILASHVEGTTRTRRKSRTNDKVDENHLHPPSSSDDKYKSEEKRPTSLAARTEDNLSAVAQELEGMSNRFYMYDHPNITFIGKTEELGDQKSRLLQHTGETENDEQMLAALKKSPLRTNNPNEADFFIPLMPMGRILMSKNGDFDTPMATLLEEEMFRKHQGHKHVIISTCYALFRRQVRHNSDMKTWYKKLYNVTVIQSWDPSAVYNALYHSRADWGEFKVLKRKGKPLTRRSASVGLGAKNEDLELALATKANFNNSTNFIFYHARPSWTYWNNSTIYRHAPITNITLENFPKSSIGWGLEKDEWQREFGDSKFCLVVRGDSPHSHALWRSIRVGCIPVILADVLPVFAPMFKSTLNMTDYAIVLKEQDVLNNPEKTLLQLNSMSDEDIEVKIKHLAFAQRVIFTDHPQSLFVPALLKEAQMATEVQL